MDDFEIDEHDVAAGDQKVLGAPVAMDQAHPARARFLHQAIKMSRQRGMAQSGGSIIRVQTQLIEYGLIAEVALAVRVAPTGAHDGRQQVGFHAFQITIDVLTPADVPPISCVLFGR